MEQTIDDKLQDGAIGQNKYFQTFDPARDSLTTTKSDYGRSQRSRAVHRRKHNRGHSTTDTAPKHRQRPQNIQDDLTAIVHKSTLKLLILVLNLLCRAVLAYPAFVSLLSRLNFKDATESQNDKTTICKVPREKIMEIDSDSSKQFAMFWFRTYHTCEQSWVGTLYPINPFLL